MKIIDKVFNNSYTKLIGYILENNTRKRAYIDIGTLKNMLISNKLVLENAHLGMDNRICLNERTILIGEQLSVDGINWLRGYNDTLEYIVFKACSKEEYSNILTKTYLACTDKKEFDNMIIVIAGNRAIIYCKSNDCRVHLEGCLSYLFTDLPKLKNVDLRVLETSNVDNLESLFLGCTHLENLDISSFNIKNCQIFNNMFAYCENLKTLKLGNFYTNTNGKERNLSGMFYGCSSLEELDLHNFKLDYTCNMQGMFEGCTNLNKLDLSKSDTTSKTNLKRVFCGCKSLDVTGLKCKDTQIIDKLNEK